MPGDLRISREPRENRRDSEPSEEIGSGGVCKGSLEIVQELFLIHGKNDKEDQKDCEKQDDFRKMFFDIFRIFFRMFDHISALS